MCEIKAKEMSAQVRNTGGTQNDKNYALLAT